MNKLISLSYVFSAFAVFYSARLTSNTPLWILIPGAIVFCITMTYALIRFKNPGYLIAWVGVVMNFLVVIINKGVMPVQASKADGYEFTSFHVPANESHRLLALSDHIDIYIGSASPGDIFIFSGALIAIVWMVFHLDDFATSSS